MFEDGGNMPKWDSCSSVKIFCLGGRKRMRRRILWNDVLWHFHWGPPSPQEFPTIAPLGQTKLE
jgi:hypothetical protein